MVGEVWSVILGTGPAFEDKHSPCPVIRAGEERSEGVLEITDMIFATRAPGEVHLVLLKGQRLIRCSQRLAQLSLSGMFTILQANKAPQGCGIHIFDSGVVRHDLPFGKPGTLT